MTTVVRLEKKPNAIPEFSTWWMENGPKMSTLSPTASVRPMICFVSWSAKTAAPATTSSASHCAGPAASGALGGRDRPQRVRGRADTDVDLRILTRGLTHDLRSRLSRVVDAERRVGKRLEPLLADRPPADGAGAVGAVLDPLERRVDLLDQVLGVLLEPLVELAHEQSRSRGRRDGRRGRTPDLRSPLPASPCG